MNVNFLSLLCILSFVLFSQNAFSGSQRSNQAANCFKLADDNDLNISWEAFKTLAKIGVPVGFANFELKGERQAKNLEELLTGFTIAIKTDEKSIISDDEGRNFNIANFFFKKMTGGQDISGQITSMSSDEIILQITMNEVTHEVPLTYTLKNTEFKAEGFIDIFDFNLHRQLKSITDICAVHEGKTWNDVKIILEANITRC